MSAKDEEFLTASSAGRETGLSPDSMRYHERVGNLPAIRTASGVRLFKRADVNAFKRTRALRASSRKRGAAA
jgi:DNA-binding transcriptional MerR regulator